MERLSHKIGCTNAITNRKILLLVDNAPMHIIDENVSLTNVAVHFLPPNTTAHLQPCDAGIINSFKASIFINSQRSFFTKLNIIYG